jgi:peptidoglycan biosynthesis protein MviN/MurJ (putative lipid II flippase)
VVTNVALGLWCIPRYGTAGALIAVVASYGAGFFTFWTTSPRSGIPFGPWIRRELVPRVLLGAVTLALSAGVLAVRPISELLPPPGWVHGAVAILVYMTAFALCFLPVGDTQRLSRLAWHMTSRVLARRGETALP